MQRGWLLVATLSVVATIACADNGYKGKDKGREKVEPQVAQYFKNDDTGTDSSVTVEGSSVGYHAIAGTIIVHPKGWDDVTQSTEAETGPPPNPETIVNPLVSPHQVILSRGKELDGPTSDVPDPELNAAFLAELRRASGEASQTRRKPKNRP